MSSADAGVLQRQKAKVKRQKSVPVLLFTFALTAERSHSGLVHRSRKPEWLYGHRGFESHPLRHFIADCRLPISDWLAIDSWTQLAIGNWKSAISERCRSGLTGSTGNAVCGNAPWVRIPPFPP